MKKRILFITLILMFFALPLCFAINNTKVKPELKKYLSSEELGKLIERIKSGNENDIVIIDVRPDTAYNNSHIPTAINIPNGITNKAFEELKNKDLILYCETGGRVEAAKKNLVKDGFDIERMLNFGGFNNYKGKTE
jgi:rhodanese-related sulfurtransferase